MSLEIITTFLREHVLGLFSGMGAVSMIPMFAEAQSVGEKSVLGVVIAGLLLFTGKYLASRPLILAALRESRQADADLNDKQIGMLIERINKAHESEVTALKQSLDRNVLRADTNEGIANAERQAKHKAVAAIHSLLLHIAVLEVDLKDAGRDAPRRPNVRMEEWQEGADITISTLLNSRIAGTAVSSVRETQRIVLPEV